MAGPDAFPQRTADDWKQARCNVAAPPHRPPGESRAALGGSSGLTLREQHSRRAAPLPIVEPATPPPLPRQMGRVQPRTMVEQAAEAIVGAAARGDFLPGDRLVEAEIARDLGISRVPVREALRFLESQGIVVSTPYKGMRLMHLTNAGAAERMRVRLALETLAVREALALPLAPDRFRPLREAAEAHAQAAHGSDAGQRIVAEERFHAALCRASGNAVLLGMWQSLSRQLVVIWAIAEPARDARVLAAEHSGLVACLERREEAAAIQRLEQHLAWHHAFDFEAALRRRRPG